MGIKKQLADAGGEQYFEGTLKNAAVPKLKGTVVEGKPACRSKELLVALSDATHAEVSLKLDAALTGKPEAGVEIQWEGVPSAFTKDPFMLTMDTEKAKIENLKTTPCAAAPAKKAAPRKSNPRNYPSRDEARGLLRAFFIGLMTSLWLLPAGEQGAILL